MADFIESLNSEQKAKFKQVFKAIGDTMEVEVKEETKQEEMVSSSQHNVAEDFTVSRESQTNRKSPVKARKNEWVDDGTFGNDIDFDYDKFEKMKTPRRRGQPKKKTVECHVCGKSFTLNANLISGEFVRCNRCTGK